MSSVRAVVLDEHADDLAVDHDEIERGAAGLDRDAAVEQALQQRGDERRAAAPDVVGLAAHDQVEVGRLVTAEVLGALLHREPRRGAGWCGRDAAHSPSSVRAS